MSDEKELATGEIVGRDKEGKAVALTKDYIITERFKKWEEYYFDKDNKETYLNATQSALKVYNVKDENSAAVIGSKNLRKVKNIGQRVGEKMGITPEKLIALAANKTKVSNNPEWWRILTKAVDMFEPLNQRDPAKFEGIEVKQDEEGKVSSIKIVKYEEDNE